MEYILQSQFNNSPIRLISSSFERLLGRTLVSQQSQIDELGLEQALYQAPFVLLSHGVESDPIFNFANLAAQNLFEIPWQEFICLPSRFSAEQPNREERARLLQTVNEQGYIDDYSGIRISSSGKRFMIKQAIVWNLLSAEGVIMGQAAMFKHWQSLP